MELVNTAEAARIIGRSPRCLVEWRRTGYGPRFYKLGQAVRYDRGDLERWIASRCVDPAATAPRVA